jgi:hypothetical protein
LIKGKKARLIAFYLPQFYPIPENNEWWGDGFTEWISVAMAKPLFKGHEQPKIPGELGFYDLRLPETRIAQADLAREHGIEGFCYWHYWLGNGKRLLERPFHEVLSSRKPDFPFCLSWANHDWKGVFFGAKGRTLIKQKYPGKKDYINHFYSLLPAFRDKRYIEVKGKKLFIIYMPDMLPNCVEFTKLWNQLAEKEGFSGFHFVGFQQEIKNLEKYGLNSVSYSRHRQIENEFLKLPFYKRLRIRLYQIRRKRIKIFPYEEAMNFFIRSKICPDTEYPTIIPNWDTTPRLGQNAVILEGANPELFRKHVRQVLESVKHKTFDDNIVFIKSWNE